MSYNGKNYFTDGGDTLHIGGKLDIEAGLMPNQAAQSGGQAADAKASINALLIKLKDAGLMVPDALSIAAANSVNDQTAGHADRTYNTGKISSVAYADGVITITLSEKVANLKDFDGGNGWGVHKWLGIGVSAGITELTDVYYNGAALTAADVEEATAMSVGSGYFVRWVAADLVLAGDNTQKSKDTFTLWASGHEKKEIKLTIVEPA